MDRPVSVVLGQDRFALDCAVLGEDGGAQHTIRMDEPPSVGGADTGPTPVEMLEAALGACKAVTARMYADRQGWPLDKVRVDVKWIKRTPGSGEKDRFEVAISLEGDLTEEQRSRLLEIAERCPVQRMLVEGAAVETAAAVH